MASGWSVCCSETHSHPTRSTGGRLSSPAILLEDHPTYQAKFLSLVDPSGEVYKFPKIIAVFCLDTTNTLNKIKCPKTFIPPHQCSRWRFCGQMSHPQTMHSLPPFRNFLQHDHPPVPCYNLWIHADTYLWINTLFSWLHVLTIQVDRIFTWRQFFKCPAGWFPLPQSFRRFSVFGFPMAAIFSTAPFFLFTFISIQRVPIKGLNPTIVISP